MIIIKRRAKRTHFAVAIDVVYSRKDRKLVLNATINENFYAKIIIESILKIIANFSIIYIVRQKVLRFIMKTAIFLKSMKQYSKNKQYWLKATQYRMVFSFTERIALVSKTEIGMVLIQP